MIGELNSLSLPERLPVHLAFIPHGHCYLWKPGLVWLHGLSDGVTALAYCCISFALIYFVRQRQDLPYPWIFQLFGAFITACGLTHVMEIWTLWHPIYWISGGLKAITAIVSLATALALIPMVPKALMIPSRRELEIAQAALEQQVRDRTQSLRENEERWQLALRGNNDGIWDWNVQTNEVFFSSRWKEMLGFDDQEIGSHLEEWSRRVHPDDLEWVMQETQEHFAQKTPFYSAEYRIQCRDGSYKWILDRGQALWDESGHVVRMAGSHTDITERKQSEQALQESEAKYRNLVNHLNAGFVVVALDTRIVQCNSMACDMLGQTMEQMLGTVATNSIWSLVCEDGSPMPIEDCPIHRVLSTQSAVTDCIVGLDREDQKRVWFLVTAYPDFDTNHHLSQVILTFVDITGLKQAETELRHLTRVLENAVLRSSTLLDTSIDGIVVLNEQGNVVQASTSFAQMIGYTLEETLQLNVVDWDAQWTKEELKQIIKENILPPMFETRHRRQDGSLYDVEISYSRVELDGDWMHFCICRDITDRKQKEIELRQAMEAAESANLAKSMFLANMSHELRTPLNVILGFAQVMTHDHLTSQQREDLQTIRRSGDHLLNLINDILDLSKIEAGHATLEVVAFDLIALLRTLRTMMVERTTARLLAVDLHVAPDVPQCIVGDEQKLRQVLLNLLSNAIKFTKQGRITLSVTVLPPLPNVDPAPNQQLALASDLHSQQVQNHPPLVLQFDITDTGAGITSEEINTIFNAFVQAEAGRKTTGGTGLGLTISRKLLELMGGAIAVRSTPGQGSTFTFTLPVSPVPEVVPPLRQLELSVVGLLPGQPHCRILVVDDQPENRRLLVRLLTYLGLEVREAANGQEAIQCAQAWHPDLTFMDIRMPICDGYEATRQIRAMEQGSGSIIIALTAQASQSDRSLSLAAGCTDYVSKPFQEETVLLKLQEYLGLQYLYAEEVALDPLTTTLVEASQSLPALTPELLSALPVDWFYALENAALGGNDRAIVELANQLPLECSVLSSHLAKLAIQFQFEQILVWLRNCFRRGSNDDVC